MTTQIAVPSIESAARGSLRSLPRVAATSFLECVATVAAEHRLQVGAELIDIAYWSRASQGAVSRFENHHSQPRNLDRLVLAYAKVCGVPAASILRDAVERWEEAGGAELPVSQFPGGPLLPPEGEIEQRAQAESRRKRAPARGTNGAAERRRGRG